MPTMFLSLPWPREMIAARGVPLWWGAALASAGVVGATLGASGTAVAGAAVAGAAGAAGVPAGAGLGAAAAVSRWIDEISSFPMTLVSSMVPVLTLNQTR